MDSARWIVMTSQAKLFTIVACVLVFATILDTIALSRSAQINEPTCIWKEGTLIVVVPCQKGVVVAADTRITDQKGNTSDGFRKLRPLGQHGVFAIAGVTVTVENSNELNPLELERSADFHDLVQEYFARRDTTALGDTPELFCGSISCLYLKLLANMSRQHAREAASEFQGRLFSMVVVTKGRNAISRCAFDGYLEEKFPAVGCRVEVVELPVGPYFVGRIEVAAELQSGKRKIFDVLRQDETIRPFLLRPANEDVSLESAVQFAQKMIRATSEMAHHLNVAATVGPCVDCALVHRDSGVEWITLSSKPPSE